MNRITAAAAMTAALIAGTVPLTLLNIHEQTQREIVLEEKRELAYYKCLDESLNINLNWIQKDGVKTYYTTEGKAVTDKRIIGAYEQTIKRCERYKEEKND
jgi:hypothetical protein